MVEGPDLRIGVLGRLEVVRDGKRVDLPVGEMRTLLVALLFPSGHVVSVDVLAYRLWPDRMPVQARGAVHTYVARLRRQSRSLTLRGPFHIRSPAAIWPR
jgi:DNA-binding SARP family transcriptional activator